LLTLLDLIEAEDAWRLMDAAANTEDGKEIHRFHFRKHRSKKAQPKEQ
jgi:hypothetical protein